MPPRKAIAFLERRLRYLIDRWTASRRNLTWDRTEAAALEAALD